MTGAELAQVLLALSVLIRAIAYLVYMSKRR